MKGGVSDAFPGWLHRLMPHGAWAISGLTAVAILAFAGNSLATRAALGTGTIEPAMFAGIRMVSGAAALALFGLTRGAPSLPQRSDLGGIACLCLYVVPFTFAYVELGAATGAVILFAAVQATLIVLSAMRGSALRLIDLAGLAVATGGLVWLLAPAMTHGSSSGLFTGAALMVGAGAAWAGYTLLGQGTADALGRTTRNFVGAMPLGAALIACSGAVPSGQGAMLAIFSGVVTSALGYAIWYRVLPRLSVATAGASQLLVPVVAAAIAVLLFGEPASIRLAGGTLLILAGLAATLIPKDRSTGENR